jgi:microsomal epoxide hydrolase
MFFEILKESGYMHIQATKPDTVGVGLNDSPVGLMTYILEKFSTWTNPAYRELPDGGLEKKYTKDELLTIVTIYWVNGNIIPSQRYYREYFANLEAQEFAKQYIHVPTGLASFPHDLGIRMPPEIVRTGMNLTHYTLMKSGGHFAAFEMPKELATDVIAFCTKTVKII